jgi:hypothetical protein
MDFLPALFITDSFFATSADSQMVRRNFPHSIIDMLSDSIGIVISDCQELFSEKLNMFTEHIRAIGDKPTNDRLSIAALV